MTYPETQKYIDELQDQVDRLTRALKLCYTAIPSFYINAEKQLRTRVQEINSIIEKELKI